MIWTIGGIFFVGFMLYLADGLVCALASEAMNINSSHKRTDKGGSYENNNNAR